MFQFLCTQLCVHDKRNEKDIGETPKPKKMGTAKNDRHQMGFAIKELIFLELKLFFTYIHSSFILYHLLDTFKINNFIKDKINLTKEVKQDISIEKKLMLRAELNIQAKP